MDWNDGSERWNSSDCSSRGPDVNSQHLHGGSEWVAMGFYSLLWYAWKQCVHVHKYMKLFSSDYFGLELHVYLIMFYWFVGNRAKNRVMDCFIHMYPEIMAVHMAIRLISYHSEINGEV